MLEVIMRYMCMEENVGSYNEIRVYGEYVRSYNEIHVYGGEC